MGLDPDLLLMCFISDTFEVMEILLVTNEGYYPLLTWISEVVISYVCAKACAHFAFRRSWRAASTSQLQFVLINLCKFLLFGTTLFF